MGIIKVSNEVLNYKGTPGIFTGLNADKPSIAPEGSKYFTTDTNTIYQFVSGVWVPIAGGGGGVASVTGNNGIFIDNTDPLNPVVQLGGALGSLGAISAELTTNREIVMPSNVLFFSLDGPIHSGPTRLAEIIPSDPFLIPNLGGFQVTENIAQFGNSQRKGFSLLETDNNNTMVWLRRGANDGFYFGTSYGNTVGAGFQNGITFFDSVENIGNHISIGRFDSDIDDGLFFQVKGTMSIHNMSPITTPVAANIAGVVWDGSDRQIQGANVNNGLSIDTTTGFAAYQLGNNTAELGSPAQLLSNREILANGFNLEITDLAGTFFGYGNSAVIGQNAAGYLTNYTAQRITFNDPTGAFESVLDPVNLILSDNTGAENLQSSSTIQLSNILSPTAFTNIQNGTIRIQDGLSGVSSITPGLYDAEDTGTSDFTHQEAGQFLASNGIAGGGSTLKKNYLAVNSPLGGGTFGVADFWGGGITTDDPVNPGNQSPVIRFGEIITAPIVVDTTRYVHMDWGGVTLKFVVAV